MANLRRSNRSKTTASAPAPTASSTSTSRPLDLLPSTLSRTTHAINYSPPMTPTRENPMSVYFTHPVIDAKYITPARLPLLPPVWAQIPAQSHTRAVPLLRSNSAFYSHWRLFMTEDLVQMVNLCMDFGRHRGTLMFPSPHCRGVITDGNRRWKHMTISDISRELRNR